MTTETSTFDPGGRPDLCPSSLTPQPTMETQAKPATYPHLTRYSALGRPLAGFPYRNSPVESYAAMRAPLDLEALTWIVPPECRGQIVEYAYADSRDGMAWQRIKDRLDGSVSYAFADMADCGCADECDCWIPQNVAPGRYDWQEVSA